MSSADQSGSQGARGAGWKGKTLALGQNPVRLGSCPQKEIFGCLFIWNIKNENVLLKASIHILWRAME